MYYKPKYIKIYSVWNNAFHQLACHDIFGHEKLIYIMYMIANYNSNTYTSELPRALLACKVIFFSNKIF